MKSKDFLEILIPIIVIAATTLFEKVRSTLRERRRRKHYSTAVLRAASTAPSQRQSPVTNPPSQLRPVEISKPSPSDNIRSSDIGQLQSDPEPVNESAAVDWRRAIIASEILNNKFINKNI